MKTRHKVVYNKCFGGFAFSHAAYELLRAAGCTSREMTESPYGCMWHGYRHDPRLVAVVESLPPGKLNTPTSKLAITEVDGPYRIDEVDGAEMVMRPDDYDWVDPAAGT